MSNWKEYKFSDFVNINPPVKLKTGETYSFVEMKDLTDGQRHCLPKAERILSGGAKFQNKDTLFARITPCLENGKISQVTGLRNDLGFGSTEFYVFRGKENISDTDFIYYLSRWEEVRAFAEMNFDGTSGRQRVPKDSFNNLFIEVPELKEQMAIASALSSLDDKIDLLQRQNKTLESLAETLFRQWFVEEANDNWQEKSLYDSVELLGGGTPKTSESEFWNGGIKWLSGGDIAKNHKNFITLSEKTISASGLANSSATVLPKFATVISARGTVGKYCLLSEGMAFSQSNYGVKPRFKDCYFFTFLLIAHSVDKLLAAAYGTVFDTITTYTFKEQSYLLPEEEDIKEFESTVKPFFEKMYSNQKQILTLTQLRDTLLPKLMSGEIRIKDFA